ncbi:Chaperone protein DnaJ [Paenibacillus plantiphilus]|uniref:Chaperone protein DnaJ n=1 Tax=Paenibacillus plantiphilus TaxID=2905650 RepID=A0ABM9C6I2_9BACL|nr:DnaJ domain-containing protein [Paenibacillus plantiphilus]CAH1203834.1 Chaperone protein DnaJ [Paenibacillus plantiphilus]
MGKFDIVTCTNCGNENRVLSEKMEFAKCAVCKKRLKGGTLYEVLEIHQTASPEGIREAYRRLAMHWHPDRNIDNVKVATAKIKQIKAAYNVLFNEESRAIYDSMLKKQSNQGTEQNSSSNTSHSNTSSQHTEKQNENRQNASYSKPKKDTAHTTNMGGNKTTKNSEANTEDTASTSAQSHSTHPAQKRNKEINIKFTPLRIAYSVFLLACMVVFIVVFVSDTGESSIAAVDTATNEQSVVTQAVSAAPVRQTDKTQEGEPPKQQSIMFQNDRPVLTYKESDAIGASYFLPNSGGNGEFTIAPGDRVEAFSGEKINIDFDVPFESDPLIKLNDLKIDGLPTATNPNITWITFTAVEGENKVSITVDNSTYEYFFDVTIETKQSSAATSSSSNTNSSSSVYYKNCTAVRDDGKAPLYAGDPGYSRKLDRDGDGVACE